MMYKMFSKNIHVIIYFPCLGSPRSFINPGGGGSNHNYSEMEMNHLLPGKELAMFSRLDNEDYVQSSTDSII